MNIYQKSRQLNLFLANLLFRSTFQIIGGFCALIGVFILALPVPIVVNRSVQWRGNCTLGKKIIVPLSSVYHFKWLHIQYIHFPVILYSYIHSMLKLHKHDPLFISLFISFVICRKWTNGRRIFEFSD